ncbi:MAG: zinc ribbon domain-containing protein [Bacteroidetes bacterium]|nr:zinc ribbon domain-containing protein [Bacteroidota bacterium]MCL2303490.1 zinc ribbon domain-containing protein [Lentimicrobiaceae bacterium]
MYDLFVSLFNDPKTFFWVILIFGLIGNLCIALWLYADAKSRGIKQWLVVLFTIMTVLSTGWWIFYLILRSTLVPKYSEVLCPQCNTLIPNDVRFCPNCGAVHSYLEVRLPKKPKIYLLVIGFLFITMIFVFILIDTLSHASNNISRSLNTMMSTTTKWGNTWNMRFQTANGTGDHIFKAKGDDWGLIYSSNIVEGSIKIDFCDIAGNVITEIVPNSSDTLWNIENGKKYKIVVTADDAKGSFSFKMKDLEKSKVIN